MGAALLVRAAHDRFQLPETPDGDPKEGPLPLDPQLARVSAGPGQGVVREGVEPAPGVALVGPAGRFRKVDERPPQHDQPQYEEAGLHAGGALRVVQGGDDPAVVGASAVFKEPPALAVRGVRVHVGVSGLHVFVVIKIV